MVLPPRFMPIHQQGRRLVVSRRLAPQQWLPPTITTHITTSLSHLTMAGGSVALTVRNIAALGRVVSADGATPIPRPIHGVEHTAADYEREQGGEDVRKGGRRAFYSELRARRGAHWLAKAVRGRLVATVHNSDKSGGSEGVESERTGGALARASQHRGPLQDVREAIKFFKYVQ